MILHTIPKDSEAYNEGTILVGESIPVMEAVEYADENEIPEEFKAIVLKSLKAAEKLNKRGAGEGVKDAMLGTFGKLFNKASERVEREPAKKYYAVILPQKLKIKPSLGTGVPKEWESLCQDVVHAGGFKKCKPDKTFKDAIYWYQFSKDKKYIYVAYYHSVAVYYVAHTQVQIAFMCFKNTEEARDIYAEGSLVEDEKTFDPSKYFSFQDEDKVNPSLFDDEKVFYRDHVYNKAITEYFNMTDRKTTKVLTHLNEAGQNTVLMNLTSKLYDKIVSKCDDIDYGEIPATKGDITKLSKYNDMKETISIMHDILKEYNQDTGPVDELSVALSNVEARKDLFERAYRYNSELPIAMYCNVVLGIISGISYMIATSIEFIKDPGTESFRVALDKMSYAKTKDHMIYSTLKSFNKTCANKDFDRAMEAVLKASTKNFTGGVVLGGIAIGILGVILVLIPVLRELIFLFYYTRMRISDFFDIQADLLQANAYALESNTTLNKTEQKKVMAKQLKTVEHFRKISNAFAIEIKKAEVASVKEKRQDDETKMLIDDIDGLDSSSGSALF